ncbi:MAG: hypothetical protein ACRCU5_12560, partial [Rhizobiaceae bacterium]
MNLLKKAAAAVLMLTIYVAAALADDKILATSEPPMTFALVRSSQTGCEPNCPQWIQAEGQIMGDTAVKFSKFMKKIGYKPYPLLLTSGGGRVDAAMKMGRQIRKLKMDVAVGGTAYLSCSPQAKGCKLPKERNGVYSGYPYSARAYCNSACPMILAAGTRRVVGQWAFLGVHQVTTRWTTSQTQYKVKYRVKNGKKKVIAKKKVGREIVKQRTTTKLSPNQKLQITGYYKTMGVNPKIIDKIVATPASTILQLSQVEMLDLGLVTSLDQADLLTSMAICKGAKPAANCVVDESKAAVAEVSVVVKTNATVEPKPSIVSVVEKPKQVVVVKPAKVQDYVDDHPMWFAVVRSSAPGCEPVCPQWISAEGFVEASTAAKFEEFMIKLGKNKLPMILSSSGGSTSDAMALGAAVAKYELDIAAGSTVFGTCRPANFQCSPKDFFTPYLGITKTFGGDTYCLGSCLAILASGKSRFAGGVTVGVMNPSELQVTDKVLVSSNAAPVDAVLSLSEYVAGKGVQMDMLRDPKRYSYYGLPYRLDMDALVKSKLLTGMEQADFFTSPSICKKSPLPYNCIALK